MKRRGAAACAAFMLAGCASINPLLPEEVSERGMLEASLSLESPFSFDGTRLGSTSIAHLWRSGLEGGVQHVHVSLTTPTGTWRVECVQELHVQGTLLQTVGGQGRVCHATPAQSDAPAWALAMVGQGDQPWRGYLVDEASAWSLTGQGLNLPDRVSPVLQARDQGRLVGVWDEVALSPRLWMDPSLEAAQRQRLEALGLLMFALDDLRDSVNDNVLDAQPIVPATQPPPPAQVAALARLGERLKALGFDEGAALLERQTQRARVERLDLHGPRLAERAGPLGRPIIELKLGPLFGAGLGWEAPAATPSGFGVHMGAGIRLTEQAQLVLEMGIDAGPYDSDALSDQSGIGRGWSNVGFGVGVGVRWALPLHGPVELTLGALARGRFASAETELRDVNGAPVDGAGFLQAGLGVAPLVGLQHATGWNDLGTRTVLFVEISPEWTSWLYGRLDAYDGEDPRLLRARGALAPLLEDDVFLLRAMFGARLEL